MLTLSEKKIRDLKKSGATIIDADGREVRLKGRLPKAKPKKQSAPVPASVKEELATPPASMNDRGSEQGEVVSVLKSIRDAMVMWAEKDTPPVPAALPSPEEVPQATRWSLEIKREGRHIKTINATGYSGKEKTSQVKHVVFTVKRDQDGTAVGLDVKTL